MKNADSVATALRTIGGAAAFVSRGTLPASALAFTVEGVGRVAFPISEATARQLCRVAQPAQHGYREETRLDRRVRDCFEIDARQIGIARDEWPATLQTQLARIARDLGLPAGCRLEAELHKLLIYGPGQFFVGHQDSEKCDAMVATLVVGLPSSFRGGTMLIEHQGETVQVRGSTSRLAFTAFYADCRHQVRPVTQGYRAALTYNLMLEGPVAAQTTPLDQLRPLTERLRRYFASPIPPRWAGEGKDGVLPDRLIYLLDHEYTQRGLDWQRLKGADGARATALQTAAATLECATCLALVEVHETWSCTSDWDGGYQSRWDYEDEDEDEDEGATGAEEQVLTDLIDSEVVLRHFVSSEGKSVKMPKQIDPRELCYTRPTVEFDPFESEHEGYMGNYGNTVDRWYHRAAVVVWPRNREFALRGKVEPGWALAELSRVLSASGAGAAAIRAAQLLPFWAQAVPVSDDENLLAQALELASGLDDAQLATGLLAPFALPQFTKGMAGPWQRCLGRYGLRWSQALLAEWLKAWDAREASRLQWIADELPDLCEASHDAATSDARALAEGLLRQEWCWIRSVWRKRSQLSASSARDAAVSALASPLLGLLAAAMRMECMAVAEEITNALTASGGDVAAEALLALDLLRAAQEQSDGRLNTNLKPLREHWLAQLAALLEQAPRRADDWSILLPMQCSCRYCMELNGFLGDGQRIRHEWPLAEAHRKHLHQIVDSHELPVTHQTRRSGRPYVLVLQKTSALFAREAAQRRVWQRNLDWLAGLTKERWSDASPGAGQPR